MARLRPIKGQINKAVHSHDISACFLVSRLCPAPARHRPRPADEPPCRDACEWFTKAIGGWDITFPSTHLGVRGGRWGAMRGRRRVSEESKRSRRLGLWVSVATCVWSTFVLWVIFWLSGIHFRAYSPLAGNRCFTLTLLVLSVRFGICIKKVCLQAPTCVCKKKKEEKNPPKMSCVSVSVSIPPQKC